MRRRVGRARREWQSSRRNGGLLEAERLIKLREVRSLYKDAMREAEFNFYKACSEAGNSDPWGAAYKLATGRFRAPPNIVCGLRLAEGHTTDVPGTLRGMLDTLCPDDNSGRDTEYHRSVRIAASIEPSGQEVVLPSQADLGKIISSLPNTAPGLDGITANIIRQAYKVCNAEMLKLYSHCIREGVFPDCWKVGQLIVLPKGNGKPIDDPKAYRPITLLPILGKILERLAIRCSPCLRGGDPCGQHGFTPGRSTTTALCALNTIVDSCQLKYCQSIFLDIAGAFDNAWWPMILLKVKQRGCPANIYRLLVSYFVNRRTGFFVGGHAVWKVLTMGCPQGSVLGPTLWNILLDDILRLPFATGVNVIAYADDLTVVVEASSRAEIERKSEASLEAIAQWGARNRLSFAPNKSQTITIKGNFKRPPCIRMSGASIAAVKQSKVLGVIVDDARSYGGHAMHVGTRAANCFGKVARVSTSSWGLRYRALKQIYGGTYIAVLTYAAAVWCRRASFYVVRSALLRSQRPALTLLTKAYRSVSTAALPVLAGVLPADLEVCRAGRVERDGQGLTGRERSALKRDAQAEAVSLWQERWDSSVDGRELYSFFPHVGARLAMPWLEPDYVLSQLLTGHGHFRDRLCRMALREASICICGEANETRDHVLWDCTEYSSERNIMLSKINKPAIGPLHHGVLVESEHNCGLFRGFAQAWYGKRKDLD